MSDQLSRYAQPSTGLFTSRDEREHGKAMQAIVFDAQETALEIEADKAVAMKIMNDVSELDASRHLLAGGDPVLNAFLLRVEARFAAKAERHLTDRGSGLL